MGGKHSHRTYSRKVESDQSGSDLCDDRLITVKYTEEDQKTYNIRTGRLSLSQCLPIIPTSADRSRIKEEIPKRILNDSEIDPKYLSCIKLPNTDRDILNKWCVLTTTYLIFLSEVSEGIHSIEKVDLKSILVQLGMPCKLKIVLHQENQTIIHADDVHVAFTLCHLATFEHVKIIILYDFINHAPVGHSNCESVHYSECERMFEWVKFAPIHMSPELEQKGCLGYYYEYCELRSAIYSHEIYKDKPASVQFKRVLPYKYIENILSIDNDDIAIIYSSDGISLRLCSIIVYNIRSDKIISTTHDIFSIDTIFSMWCGRSANACEKIKSTIHESFTVTQIIDIICQYV
ncbi:MAG: hypothetical protein Hyperionvirus3_167 [Hyperionvirus sp.]|uniref:Uncharacterized protein n=1 Tax=Hyperionvirus sp. TaxID=2487770 RepID=A0A3G5A9Z7_9VIRU|nr:MAG: hypothetical protein Hyperionvirus3_167 [Hyperionvirus sp.]